MAQLPYTPPVWPGCEAKNSNEDLMACFQRAMMGFVSQNVIYPEEARLQEIQGLVFVDFIVEENGSVTHVEIGRSVHPLLDREASRVVHSMPRMVSGAIADGDFIRISYTVPVNFRLEERTKNNKR
jgi:TonB family protein